MAESSGSTKPRSSRHWRALVTADRMVLHNVIVGAGTIAAGVLGVAFQSLVSHSLRPTDYGSVFAVVTLITVVGLPATAFTLLMARETSRDRARDRYAESAALLYNANRALLLCGLGFGGLLAVSAPVLSGFLSIPASLLIAAALGLPFTLSLPLLLGEFQGAQHFLSFSAISVGQAALKLGAAIGLGALFGPVGIIAGVSLGTFLAYMTAAQMLRQRFAIRSSLPWFRTAASYLAVVLPSTLALSILLSSDVLLVKHFFPARASGEYAAVAALGRAIFWGASGVATVLFPKVILRTALGQHGSHLVAASLVLVAAGGAFGLVVLWWSSNWLLTAFAGSAYASGAGYLPGYALGMTLLGGAAVLIATHQSRGKLDFLFVLIPLSLMEPGLIAIFHETLAQVILVVDVSMALVVCGLGGLYAVRARAGEKESLVVPPDASSAATMTAFQAPR